MEDVFFDNWGGMLRIIISTIAAYITLVITLRISGKRTLAKMNAFDFVVTVALGSMLGGLILNKSIPLAEGILAMILLIMLQYFISYFSVRSKAFKKLVSSNPTLLVYKGEWLHDTLKQQRISTEEIHKAVRESGRADLHNIDAIVLEATGDISVISSMDHINQSSMADIENLPAIKEEKDNSR